jgi:hypothetical protein
MSELALYALEWHMHIAHERGDIDALWMWHLCLAQITGRR